MRPFVEWSKTIKASKVPQADEGGLQHEPS
jgi:hypothetical protein